MPSSRVSNALRFLAAILIGMFLLLLFVEPLEFVIVALARGGMTTDETLYFSTRNLPWFQALKLVYNTLGAIAAAYVGARFVAGIERPYGIAFGGIQGALLIWASTDPGLSRNAPQWLWFALAALTFCGAYIGATWRARLRCARASVQAIAKPTPSDPDSVKCESGQGR